MVHRGAALCCDGAFRFFVAADCLCTGFLSASSGDGTGGKTGGATFSGDGCLAAGCTRASGESAGSLKMIDFELDMITFRADPSSTGVAVGLACEPALRLAGDVLPVASSAFFDKSSCGTTTAADFDPGKIVRWESILTAGIEFDFEVPGSRPPART
jgi:hypothetical protein